MKIRKGDTVIVNVGKDSGKSGKVTSVNPQTERIVVDGINLRKKNVRAKRAGEKGQIITIPGSLHISNAMLRCPHCSKATRVGFAISVDGKKQRQCKRCQKTF